MRELENIDWTKILHKLSSYATSEQCRLNLEEILPLKSAEAAVQQFAVTSECQSVLSLGERPYMESLDLYSTWFNRIQKNAVLKTIELKDVRRFCIEVIALDEVIRPFDSKWLEEQKSKLMDATGPLSAIDHLMTSAC